MSWVVEEGCWARSEDLLLIFFPRPGLQPQQPYPLNESGSLGALK